MNTYDYYLTGAAVCLCVAVAVTAWRLNVVNKNLHYMKEMFELFAQASVHHIQELNKQVETLNSKKKNKQDA
jgi:hypothetical protein